MCSISDQASPFGNDFRPLTASKQWYYSCRSVCSLARKLWTFRSKLHVSQLCVGYMLHTMEGMMWLLGQPAHFAERHCWSSGSGPQSQAAPHKSGKVLWNAGGSRSGTKGAGVLPPAMVAHLGQQACLRWLPLLLGKTYDQLPFPKREA